MVAAILEGGRVTIDVAKLRSLARYQNDAVITAEEITELLDAYEERDRLRAARREIGNQAANINHHCYQTGKLQCVSCAGSQELIEELARAALEGRE